MKKHLFVTLAILFWGIPPDTFAQRNLVKNSTFDQGLDHWQVRFAEPNETKYARNHEWTAVVPDPKGTGKCIRFTLSPGVAASEGVKAVTPLIPIEKGMKYRFGADALSEGPSVKIFLEGYYEDPDQQTSGDNRYKGFRRIYRKVIHAHGAGGDWKTFIQTISPPKRYQPTHVAIKLYAYHPAGTAYFRKVTLVQCDDPSE